MVLTFKKGRAPLFELISSLVLIVLFCSFNSFTLASSQYSLPSMIISNWEDSSITWANSHDCREHNPVRYPGVTSYRFSGSGWDKSAIDQDTFAISWSGKPFADPAQLQGTDGAGMTVSAAKGTFSSLYNRYSGGPLNPVDKPNTPFTVERTIFMPPHEQFYVVQYNVTNVSPSASPFSLLDYIVSPQLSNSQSGYILPGNQSALVHVDSKMVLVSGAFPSTNLTQYQVGGNPKAQPQSSALNQFAQQESLRMSRSAVSNAISIGFMTQGHLMPGKSKTFSYYRILQTSRDNAQTVQQRILSKPVVDWQQYTSDLYQEWLAKSKLYSSNSDLTDVSPSKLALFNNSLVLLKNGQNPELGSIAASFHPLYGYKVWMRDGLFAAMILDAAGYHNEAAKFIQWASTVELREQDGAFHTTYDVWTGNVVSFVEPQYDPDGAYLLAVLHHLILVGNSNSFLDSVKTRIRQIEDFYLNHKGKYGFIPPDYSIWEESSDPHTGKPLPTSYFAFSQSMAFGGLQSAVNIERTIGDSKSSNRIVDLTKRAKEVQTAIQQHLYNETHSYFMRGIWSDTLKPDTRVDGSSTAVIFQGVCNDTGVMGWDKRQQPHLEKVVSTLGRLDNGIARYEADPFFYDSLYNPCGQEVGAPSPPWGVVTMFTAWSEFQLAKYSQDREGAKSLRQRAQQRIEWMVRHSAKGNAPVGEAVGGVSGNFVWASAPDIYEHGGVYIWSVLIDQGLADLPNPLTWSRLNLNN